MPSELKSDTARTNGAKSHGPITPEGRAKSSANSIRHGLTAKFEVLPNESAEEFELLLNSYVDQFQPQTKVEMDLVETMAITRLRLRRIVTIETNLLSTEMERRAEDIDREFDMDGDGRLAWVFQKLADQGQSLALLVRYEGTLNRSYDRVFKQLLLLQTARNGAGNAEAASSLGSFGCGPVPAPIPAPPPPAGRPPASAQEDSEPRIVAQPVTDTTPVPTGSFSDS